MCLYGYTMPCATYKYMYNTDLYNAFPASKSVQSIAKSICLTKGDNLLTRSIAMPHTATGCSDKILCNIMEDMNRVALLMATPTYW